MGPRTREFEHAFAELFGAPHAVAVSSCTAALHLALLGGRHRRRRRGHRPGADVRRRRSRRPLLRRHAGARRVVRSRRSQPRSGGRRTPRSGRARGPFSPRTGSATRATWRRSSGCATTRAGADRGLRPEHHRARRRRAAAPARSARRVLLVLLQEAAGVGEGGMILTADEAARRQGALPALARDDLVTWDRHRGHAESYDVVDVGFNFRIDEPRAALGLSRLARLRRRHRAPARARARVPRTAPGRPGITIPWTDEDVERELTLRLRVLLDTGASAHASPASSRPRDPDHALSGTRPAERLSRPCARPRAEASGRSPSSAAAVVHLRPSGRSTSGRRADHCWQRTRPRRAERAMRAADVAEVPRARRRPARIGPLAGYAARFRGSSWWP